MDDVKCSSTARRPLAAIDVVHKILMEIWNDVIQGDLLLIHHWAEKKNSLAIEGFLLSGLPDVYINWAKEKARSVIFHVGTAAVTQKRFTKTVGRVLIHRGLLMHFC